jgi:hypothetical protein
MKEIEQALCLARASDNGDKCRPLGETFRTTCCRLSPFVTGKSMRSPTPGRGGTAASSNGNGKLRGGGTHRTLCIFREQLSGGPRAATSM